MMMIIMLMMMVGVAGGGGNRGGGWVGMGRIGLDWIGSVYITTPMPP